MSSPTQKCFAANIALFYYFSVPVGKNLVQLTSVVYKGPRQFQAGFIS